MKYSSKLTYLRKFKKRLNFKVNVKKAKIKKPTDEIGGYNGLEPTRYGDWEHNGRCTDF